ncbi:MAG: hypothetical protein ABIO36_08705 [Pyrinomonadaceae bacterium]
MKRLRNLITIGAFSLLVLGIPAIASAQSRDRDDDRYGNNGSYGNGNGGYNNGGYNNGQYGNNGNYGDMRSIVRNLKNNARELQKHLDRDLDRSRYDGTRREDQLNGLARQFKDAVNRLSESNNGRQDNNVQRVLDLGSQLERPLSRSGLDYHITETWSEIRGDLRQLSNSYGGYNNNNNNRNNRNNRNGGYGNGTYNRPSWWPF